MSRLKTTLVKENRVAATLAEERWHLLVLALLTERVVTAARSRAAGHSNGNSSQHHNGGFPANPRLGNGRRSPNGGGAEPGTNGSPKPSTETPRANGASEAHHGAGVAGVAGASRARVDKRDVGSFLESWPRLRDWLRAYFASEHCRSLQTALGLLWLLDGLLQFQPFMYSHGFIAMLNDTASGQPGWVAGPMKWAAHHVEPNLAFFNTLFALTQVGIGLGLLYRHTVKRALVASFAWAVFVWWFGEGFGNLLTGTASPLTGAPGAVLLYAIIGLLAWPSDHPGGLLGRHGAKTAWTTLWLVMAWAWLLGPNSSPDATSNAISSAPSGLGVLSRLRDAFADAANGNGLIIAFLLSLASAAIAASVALDTHPRRFLKLAIGLSLAYWVIGQGLGGIFTGTATDPNTGLMFVLLAVAFWPLTAHSPATSVYRRFGLSQVAVAQSQTIRRVGLLGTVVVAAGLITVIGEFSGGGSSSPAHITGPLASLGHLKSPGSPGPIGPEGLPVPNAPPLAGAASATNTKAVDGIPSCTRQAPIMARREAHLAVFVQGFARQIPAGIGITDGHTRNTPRGTLIATENCASVLHTNAADGLIQVESPTQQNYTLGDFFDVWGQPLSRERVGPSAGRVTVFINGKPYAGNPRDIPLSGNPHIQLDVGRPLVAPESNNTATDVPL